MDTNFNTTIFLSHVKDTLLGLASIADELLNERIQREKEEQEKSDAINDIWVSPVHAAEIMKCTLPTVTRRAEDEKIIYKEVGGAKLRKRRMYLLSSLLPYCVDNSVYESIQKLYHQSN